MKTRWTLALLALLVSGTALAHQDGDWVLARWKGGDDWYAGKIIKIARDGVTISIAYDDGDREDTSTGACRSK